jgi:thymidylate synthase ThyX
MSLSGPDIFCLTDENGRLLQPAVQATVLAKYSRSPMSARELVKNLTVEEADKFQGKYVIEFNHSSVAELAALPVCFEGVSIVASKFLESFQRMGYSEKSTRYQVFTRDSFITPPGAPSTMKEFAARFYDAYEKLYPRVVRRVAILMGKDPEDPKSLADRTVKARAFDNIRYLLPAGTGTNLAAKGFLRDFRYMIQEARGHSNPEIRAIGDGAHAAISEICPVLVQKSEPDSFEPRIRGLGNLPPKFRIDNPSWYVELHKPHTLGDPKVLHESFVADLADRYGLSWSAFCKLMEERGRRAVPKIFRTVRISFDIMMDYGAYRDLQRHRRCEQYSEPLTPFYGYVVPDDIVGTDMEPEYRIAMEQVHLYNDDRVSHDSDLMQYMIPLGYLHRSVFDMDLQELYYITELRTQPQGHISYRRVAYEMARLGTDLYPQLMRWCRAQQPESIGIHN